MTLCTLLAHGFGFAAAPAAHAFSSPASYGDPVVMGGGGGRWFTGSTADGYGCDVCHEGAAGADLAITGLPTGGFVPGSAYEITIAWPLTAENVALIAELTDEQRQGAGTLALPRPDALQPLEACSGDQLGFPASELHMADAGRQLVSVIDCGARMLRFQWTAPLIASGPVWLNVGFVVSDVLADPSGDGVTMVSRPLPPQGTSLPERVVAQQGCSATPSARAAGWGAMLATWAVVASLARRRGRRLKRRWC